MNLVNYNMDNMMIYKNGNYLVKVDYLGTKTKTTLRQGETFIPEFPDSLDIKLTNKCSFGCPFCHESSTSLGKTCKSIRPLKNMLSELPEGVELAFGGGDLTDIPETTKTILHWSIMKGYLPRITLNVKDFLDKKRYIIARNFLDINSSISCGVSIKNLDEARRFRNTLGYMFNNIFVFHIIIGVFPYDQLEELLKISGYPGIEDPHILILGFKQFGRASDTKIDQSVLEGWKNTIRNLIVKTRLHHNIGFDMCDNYRLAFDNLAIEQLELKKFLLDDEWNRIFMGNEFSHSMYIDAVNEEFAPTSRSPYTERVKWSDTKGLVDWFNKNKRSYE